MRHDLGIIRYGSRSRIVSGWGPLCRWVYFATRFCLLSVVGLLASLLCELKRIVKEPQRRRFVLPYLFLIGRW